MVDEAEWKRISDLMRAEYDKNHVLFLASKEAWVRYSKVRDEARILEREWRAASDAYLNSPYSKEFDRLFKERQKLLPLKERIRRWWNTKKS